MRYREPWTLQDVWRALQSRRWRKRVLARVKWRLGLLPDVFLTTSPRFGPYLVVAGKGLPWASWHAMYAADPCVYCGRRADTLDHIQPRARGGWRNGWENIAPACEPCNAAKGARPLLLFLTGLRGTSHRHIRQGTSRSRSVRKAQRAFVRHMLHPEKCPPPLRYPIGAQLMDALEKRRTP